MANSTFQIPVVALDIGYFSVKGASRREKNDTIKAFQFPSQCSHVSSVHKTSMGMAALSGANVTVNGAEYFVGKDVVLQTSARQTRAITENYADSPEYKALFLGGLYYFLSDYAGELRGKNEVEIRRMVAGLPMNMVCDRIKPGIKDDPLVVERVDEAIREGYEEITLGGKKYRMDDYLPIADGRIQK
ncbi:MULTISPECIES: hypothetical protein [Acidovorax]|jgi:hypothetical protein|nr:MULTISPECIES: hypothetical protein [Acidovorax]HQT51523.1 hypothetical protein [Acidovorax defluvii]